MLCDAACARVWADSDHVGGVGGRDGGVGGSAFGNERIWADSDDVGGVGGRDGGVGGSVLGEGTRSGVCTDSDDVG